MDKYGRSGSCNDRLSIELSNYLRDPITGKINEVFIQKVAMDNKIEISKWKHLRNGHRRMLLGNVLRAKLKRGERVIIGGSSFSNSS